jgi:hypothetical protein
MMYKDGISPQVTRRLIASSTIKPQNRISNKTLKIIPPRIITRSRLHSSSSESIMAPKKRFAVAPPSPPSTVSKRKRVRKTSQAVPSDDPEAPGWQLSLEELSAFIPDQVRGYAAGAKVMFYDPQEMEEKAN